MIKLYRGHRIEVVRQKEHIHYRVERLRDGELLDGGEYGVGWKVREVITDLEAMLDLELGALDNG